nr:hypothetical protein HmN_000963300 [Hymenolepis microstoma]
MEFRNSLSSLETNLFELKDSTNQSETSTSREVSPFNPVNPSIKPEPMVLLRPLTSVKLQLLFRRYRGLWKGNRYKTTTTTKKLKKQLLRRQCNLNRNLLQCRFFNHGHNNTNKPLRLNQRPRHTNRNHSPG